MKEKLPRKLKKKLKKQTLIKLEKINIVNNFFETKENLGKIICDFLEFKKYDYITYTVCELNINLKFTFNFIISLSNKNNYYLVYNYFGNEYYGLFIGEISEPQLNNLIKEFQSFERNYIFS